MNRLIQSVLLSLAASPPHAASPLPAPAASLEGNPTSLQVHQWADGAVYSLQAAPGQVSLVALEPGERLVSVAAGDTAQWVIGDTTSGSAESLRSHILVKPAMPGLRTNMIVTTDRRVYQLALESRARAPLSSLRWTYAAPGLIAVKAPREAACKSGATPDLAALNFNYRVEGDKVPWRPIRIFDDGRQTYIEFAPSLGQVEAPPLFLKGADGRLELVNYRVKGRYYVVDRIFGTAELRLGEKQQQKVSILRAGSASPLSSGKGA